MSTADHAARIACIHYDVLELACMHLDPVRVETFDGFVVEGVATDLRMDGGRNEFLVMRGDDREFLVRLTAVSRVEPIGDNAHFGPIDFSGDA